MAFKRAGRLLIAIGAMAFAPFLHPATPGAQEAQPAADKNLGTCTVDADGTARITRAIPIPTTISAEAQKSIANARPFNPGADMAVSREWTEKWRKATEEKARQLWPVEVEEKTLGGVRTAIITPQASPPEKRDRVLINVHGGGFMTDSGSLVEGIPVAHLTGTRVVSVYYRLAPEHPFPAAVDDTVAVYKELLKTYQPNHIGIYGTSAGAILTAEVAVELRRLGLPLPAALGIFSGAGDLSQAGDSQAFFTLPGLVGELSPPERGPLLKPYVGNRDPKDPVLSPLYADLRGFPPALLITSTRDILLSGTAILHRAFLRAGVDAELVVFEALPHAFWNDYDLPESRETYEIMAKFFNQKLGGRR
jgi:monoterpene epsilon-lactone hydrolase